MLRRAANFLKPALFARRMSTVSPYFDEHYQYPGNPTNEEFTEFMLGERKPLVQDTTVFKPKEQIEFNRTGELLLYEAEPYRAKEILFPYPYCLGTVSIPWMLYMYFANPLELVWQWNSWFLYIGGAAWYPMVEYYFGLRFYISKISLMRGGKALRLEHSNISGVRYVTWIFVDEIHLITADKKLFEPENGLQAEPVGEDGQLKYEVQFQVDNFVDAGRNMQDQVLTLVKEGTVHHPEILEAVLKGFEIDTSNFRINTLHTERWFEPNTNI